MSDRTLVISDTIYNFCYTIYKGITIMDKVDFEFKINDKSYNEPFARHLLAYLYDPILANAENKDKPDIWNISSNYGVEITTLTDTYYNTLNRYKRVWARREMTLEQIVKNQPTLLQGKLGVNKHGNLILLKTTEGRRTVAKSQKGLATTVAMKLRKLQSYRIFNRNDLFIFAPNLHVACTPQKIGQALANLEKLTNIKIDNFKNLYDNILIYNYTEIMIFPFKEKGVMRIIEVPSEIREKCNALATKEADKINLAKELKKQNKRKTIADSELEIEK